MNAKQTPLVDILRLHLRAEDLHSDYGHNKSVRLLSQAADEIERLRSNSLALEDEKNDYMDGVGDVLRQGRDGETLWAAAQRVMSECDRLRAELAEARKPDCLLCKNYYEREDENDHALYRGCALRLRLTPSDCINGSEFISVGPVRLYEKEGKV